MIIHSFKFVVPLAPLKLLILILLTSIITLRIMRFWLFIGKVLTIQTLFLKFLTDLLYIELIAIILILIFMNEFTDPASALLLATVQFFHLIFQMRSLTYLAVVGTCFTYRLDIIYQYFAAFIKTKLVYIRLQLLNLLIWVFLKFLYFHFVILNVRLRWFIVFQCALYQFD